MALTKADSFKSFFIHLAIIFGIIAVSIVLFFYIYLPFTTNHGESITVPNMVGMKYAEVENFLSSRTLRYEVSTDSGYSADLPPLSVIKQYPLPNSQVKENRKIYLYLNSNTPPKVKIPKLVGTSAKNAQMLLQSIGLKLGDIKYVPDMFQNLVLKQKLDGIDVPEGTFVPQGSKINLEVGDGLGNTELEVPNLVGQTEEDAELVLLGSGLKVGTKIYEVNTSQTAGMVIKQNPEPSNQKVRVGESVNLTISKDKASEAGQIKQ